MMILSGFSSVLERPLVSVCSYMMVLERCILKPSTVLFKAKHAKDAQRSCPVKSPDPRPICPTQDIARFRFISPGIVSKPNSSLRNKHTMGFIELLLRYHDTDTFIDGGGCVLSHRCLFFLALSQVYSSNDQRSAFQHSIPLLFFSRFNTRSRCFSSPVGPD